MLLYHGSNVVVRTPRILTPSRALDFGPGFYTTSSMQKAERWSVLTTRRRREGSPIVTTFSLDDDLLDLDVLTFESATEDWLVFVSQNRKNAYRGPRHDIVAGPVANDRTMAVIGSYMAGEIDAQTALVLLLPQKLDDQHAFLSHRALQRLTFEGVASVES